MRFRKRPLGFCCRCSLVCTCFMRGPAHLGSIHLMLLSAEAITGTSSQRIGRCRRHHLCVACLLNFRDVSFALTLAQPTLEGFSSILRQARPLCAHASRLNVFGLAQRAFNSH